MIQEFSRPPAQAPSTRSSRRMLPSHRPGQGPPCLARRPHATLNFLQTCCRYRVAPEKLKYSSASSPCSWPVWGRAPRPSRELALDRHRCRCSAQPCSSSQARDEVKKKGATFDSFGPQTCLHSSGDAGPQTVRASYGEILAGCAESGAALLHSSRVSSLLPRLWRPRRPGQRAILVSKLGSSLPY